MNRGVLSVGRVWTGFGLLAFALAAPVPAHATKHVVEFGGTVGFAYSPSSLSVSVGDTVRWQGAFEMHPFGSTSVPAGAAAWQNSAGVVFEYVVLVPGTYAYVCNIHSPGMSGSFTATVADLREDAAGEVPAAFELRQNYPNPFNPATAITFSLPEATYVTLKIFNLLGGEVATLVSGQLNPGVHTVQWDAEGAASGRYFYALEAGEFKQTRGMVLLR